MRFFRFRGSLWEVIWGQNSELFSDSIFSINFFVNFLQGPAAGVGPLEALKTRKNLKDLQDLNLEALNTPCHTLRGGADIF